MALQRRPSNNFKSSVKNLQYTECIIYAQFVLAMQSLTENKTVHFKFEFYSQFLINHESHETSVQLWELERNR